MNTKQKPLFAKVPGHDVWMTNQKPKGKHAGAYARKRVWAVEDKPANGQEVDLTAVAQALNDIEQEVNEQYIDRGRLIEAVKLALASGQHVFVKSLPGAAKTAIGVSWANALDGIVHEVQFGIDTNKDELIGGYDPNLAAQGRWVRIPDRLAIADIFIADEIWEAPSEITNLLKGALNEAKIDGDSIPLKTCMAMSNVLPADYKTSADYDRYLIRLTVDYLTDVEDFGRMLTAIAGEVDVNANVDMQQVMILAAVGQFLAKHDPSPEIVEGMKDIWTRFQTEGIAVSDRRWGEAYKLAYANALAQGETPDKGHLLACQYVLWVDPQDEAKARRIIFEVADKFGAARLQFEARIEEFAQLYDEAVQAYTNFAPDDQDGKVQATTLAMQLETDLDAFVEQVRTHSTESGWSKVSQELTGQVGDMLDQVETLIMASRKKTVTRPDPLHDGQGFTRR